MSTLRISNIEAKSVPASATIDEKVKITNSSGDPLVFIDGKTSGITTVGINTTDPNITFDANSNVVVTGIITATRFSGQITPTSLEIGSNIKLGNAGVITATSFVGSGANLTGISAGTSLSGSTNNTVCTVTGANAIQGEANFTFDGNDMHIVHDGLAVNIFESNDNHSRLRIRSGDSSLAQLEFADQTDADAGEIRYDHANEKMTFHVGNNTERVGITSAGYVGVGENSPATILHVKANVGDMLRLDRNNTGAVGNQIAFRHSASGTLTETGSINCVSTANAAAGELRFYTKTSGGSNTEKLRIDSSGDVSITDGNLIMASGHGIDFSATSDSGNGTKSNELFDDYEEGSWTPTFSTANAAGTLGSLSYDLQEGRYIKIGATVYIEGALRTSNVANNGNGTYDIAGLPFTNTSGGSTGVHGIIHCGSQHSWTNAPNTFDPIGSATYMRARGGIDVGDGTYTNGTTADFNTGTGSKNRVYFSGVYSTDF